MKIVCVRCGKEFNKELSCGVKRKYCSDVCCQQSYYYRNRERLLKEGRERYFKDDAYAEHKRALIRRWKKANPDKYKRIVRRCQEKYREKNNKINYIRELHNKYIEKCECDNCGSKIDLQLHHIEYKRKFVGEVLCRKCHVETHKIEKRRKDVGILSDDLFEGYR